MKLQSIVSALQEYQTRADVDLIHRAYAFVREHHKGQTRASGEPYITHVTEVAGLATKLRLDAPSVATALLHDTVEDTAVTVEEIRAQFGSEVAELVDGVTKLNQVNFTSREEQQSENFRKMLLAMAKDIRVLLIKLCDRMHNMQTLEFLSISRQTRIAQETLDIYAPLAHRLGIHWMKSELEDLSFRYLKPDVYAELKQQVNKKKKEREQYIEHTTRLLERELQNNSLKGEVTGRPKHFYSIFKKMEEQGLQFDEIYDLIGFRMIVPTTMDCYAALGVVHAAWKPIPGRFKDYIAMPKPNKYQSLHTTVIGPQGARIEIQIRTPEMHEVAERGIAAHWVYKEDGEGAANRGGMQFPWLRDLVESEQSLSDPVEFLTFVKADLFPQEVFVFSPKGDLVALPTGATPIDFAYHIHSEVGQHCVGARIDGQQVPLTYRLQNGDTVEVITSKTQHPSKDWLTSVVTTKAKQRIRSWLKSEERARSVMVGREMLSKDLRKVKLSLATVSKNGELQKVAEALGFKEIENLIAEVGYGKITTNQVVGKLLPDETDIESKLAEEQSALQKIFQKAARVFRDTSGVKVNGLDDVVFRFARCCEPLPGDELVGYVTRGRGVAIHTRGCPQTFGFDARRLVPVQWDDEAQVKRSVKLTVICVDKVGMLAAMSQSISSAGASIIVATSTAMDDGKAFNTFEIGVESAAQLEQIRKSMAAIKGVISVERTRRPIAPAEVAEEED